MNKQFREAVTKLSFWSGWSILIAIPIVFVIETVVLQDLPSVQLWEWGLPFVAITMIYIGRGRDEVLNHHLV